MDTTPHGESTHLLHPPVDNGYWSELQAKLASHHDSVTDEFEQSIDIALERLEEKFKSYVTADSFKRSIRRPK